MPVATDPADTLKAAPSVFSHTPSLQALFRTYGAPVLLALARSQKL